MAVTHQSHSRSGRGNMTARAATETGRQPPLQVTMNRLVRAFLMNLRGPDGVIRAASGSIREIEFPDGQDPLRVFLRAFPEYTDNMIELVDEMDALRVGNTKPLSGSSTSTEPEQLCDQNETEEEATIRKLRAIGDKRTKKATKVVKAALGTATIKIDFIPFRVEHDSASSYSIVRETYAEHMTYKLICDLKKPLNDIDAEFLAEQSTSSPTEHVIAAFKSEYNGYAHCRLLEYVQLCWNTFCKGNSTYTRPYCAIVQSSGFGKSRLLRELAIKTETLTTTRMNVMYLCVRDIKESSGYPMATRGLHEHFFPGDVHDQDEATLVSQLAGRLHTAFVCVMLGQSPADMALVHEMLLGLFEGKERKLLAALTGHNIATTRDQGIRDLEKIPHLLVFAVDEARALLPKPHDRGIGWFRLLRRALVKVNYRIASDERWPKDSGVFGIVVDTNSKFADFVPSTKQDPSSRPDQHFRLFPPFVLTETMDVLYPGGSKIHQYEADVLQAITAREMKSTSIWDALKLLGRPLWMACEGGVNELSAFAAKKLLLGRSPHTPSSLTEDTMYGVASVLCRAGLRPYSSSSLASRAVADFMAVLSYVGYEHDQFISTYSSDPVLTLGATRIWHGMAENALAQTILPQFRKMLHQDLMDTGGAGEMVARIVLLLAMDACGVLDTGNESERWSRAGVFTSVWTFLTALHGDAPRLKRTVRLPNEPPRKAGGHNWECYETGEDELNVAMDSLKNDWKDWCVSFTHFVQLVEHPSEDCLWAMLARRAAGAFPRGQRGVDLVIPICTATGHDKEAKARISMILIQAKNWESNDPQFPMSATVAMRPFVIFKRGDYKVPKEKKMFQELAPSSVLRIYMSLRDSDSERFYLQDDDPDRSPTYVLCTQGLGGWFSRPDPATSPSWQSHSSSEAEDGRLVEVLSSDVAIQLKELLRPWWKVATMIEEDVRARDHAKHVGMSGRDLVTYGKKPLPETLLFNDGKLGQLQSRLGRIVVGDNETTAAASESDSTFSSMFFTMGEDGDTNMDFASAENESSDLHSPRPKKPKVSPIDMDLS